MVNRFFVGPVLIVAAACVTPAVVHAQDYDIGIALGATPQAVTLQDLEGKSADLTQYVGKKPVIFEFWATWCPLCQALIPKMEAARAKYGNRVEFVAIGVGVNQTPASIKRHLAQHPIPFKVLWDGDGAAVRAFDAPATSYVVVLDAAGRVVYHGQGADQDVDAAVAKAFPAEKRGS